MRFITILILLSLTLAISGRAADIEVLPAASVMDALDSAADGGTIYLQPGIYHESLIVNKTVTITGQENAIIDGGVRILADGVVLLGITIGGSGMILGSNSSRIEECNVSGCAGSGVVITGSGNIIINSSITGNSHVGIEIWGSSNTVQWNRINANDDCGIVVYGNDNVIESNALLENVHDGMEIEGAGNLIARNNVSMSQGAGIELLNMSRGNMIEGNMICRNGECGIEVVESYENNISGNSLIGNDVGIKTERATNNLIFSNTVIYTMQDGIRISDESRCNTVHRNNASNNHGAGIKIEGSNDNMILGNSVHSNAVGIDISRSENNTIRGNHVVMNGVGIHLDVYSTDNTLYHNAMIDNRQSALDSSVHYGKNSWDNGSEGNYYSDHVCHAECSAYEIPSGEEINSIDRFPLSSWDEGFMAVKFMWPTRGCVPAYAKGLAI
ncbi:MAG: right-handed parallel beta-helix repeat-containing protein [Methanothrix sp.]|nr:right-handed parallel beta-helix repeat-containing protein [Methanothrix sp.]MCX8207612.1 right-handed parallel beta-helix repeat-containing protein [Methanothrix sp.]